MRVSKWPTTDTHTLLHTNTFLHPKTKREAMSLKLWQPSASWSGRPEPIWVLEVNLPLGLFVRASMTLTEAKALGGSLMAYPIGESHE